MPRALAAILAAAAAAYVIGLPWGLPSARRAELVLLPSQRDGGFYWALEDNRRAMYDRIGPNLQAAFGRGEWTGTLLPPPRGFTVVRYPAGARPDPVLMHGFSSFLLRSVEQDEQFVLNALSRFRPRQLQFDPHETLYGGGYLYPLAAALAAAHLVGLARLSTDPLAYYRRPDDLGRLYEIGRAWSAVCGLGCTVAVFLLGRELHGQAAGLRACALFALSPCMVSLAHVMKPHIPGALAALLALWQTSRGLRTPEEGERPFVAAAALLGASVACAKYYVVLAWPLALCYGASRRGAPPGRTAWRLLGFAALAAAVFLALDPYVLADWRDLIDESRALTRWYAAPSRARAYLDLWAVPLRLGCGSWTWAAGLLGLSLAARRRSAADVKLWALLAPLTLGVALALGGGLSDPSAARFCLPLVGLLCVAAAALPELAPRAGAFAARLALAALLACDLGWAAAADDAFRRDARGESNAFAAAAWAASSLPTGSSIGIPTPAPMVDRFPPLAFSRYELVYAAGPVAGRERELPERFVTRVEWADSLPQDWKAAYEAERSFDAPGLFGRPFHDPFSEANFTVAVLRRRR